jgi:hypothetical protein
MTLDVHQHEWGEASVCQCGLTLDTYKRLHGYEGYPHPYCEGEDQFEVVWSGKGLLLPPRETKPDEMWTPPKRAWNRVCKVCGGFVYKCERFGHTPLSGDVTKKETV